MSYLLALAWFIVGAFFLQGLRRIPADPPYIAVVTLFGRRTRTIKKEGWRFFPFFPLVYGLITVRMTKRNVDLPPIRARTKDGGEVVVSVAVTWSPDAAYAIEFLDNGADEGVNGMLRDMIQQRVREWCVTLSWIQAISAQDDTTGLLVCELAGLRSQQEPGDVAHRLRVGDAAFGIPHLGITLNRLSIVEIALAGDLNRAAELALNAEIVNEVAARLGVSTAEAVELFQTQAGRVSKHVTEIRGDISERARRLAELLVKDRSSTRDD